MSGSDPYDIVHSGPDLCVIQQTQAERNSIVQISVPNGLNMQIPEQEIAKTTFTLTPTPPARNTECFTVAPAVAIAILFVIPEGNPRLQMLPLLLPQL